MNRKILCHSGRLALWSLWSQLRAVVNQKAPFTFRGAEHGDALRDVAQAVEAVLDGHGTYEPVDYDDGQFRFVRARLRKDLEREDEEEHKADPKYSPPRSLVVCEGGVGYLRDLAKRLYREDRITVEEAERCAAHLYAVIEGQKVRVWGDAGAIEAIVYESFTFRTGEYRLAPIPQEELLVSEILTRPARPLGFPGDLARPTCPAPLTEDLPIGPARCLPVVAPRSATATRRVSTRVDGPGSVSLPGRPCQDLSVYKYDDVSWKPFLAAVARGERCEVDEEFYDYWLGVLPPIFMNRTVELVDGTSRRVAFGAAEGDGVPVDAFWREGERCFAQRSKLRTQG